MKEVSADRFEAWVLAQLRNLRLDEALLGTVLAAANEADAARAEPLREQDRMLRGRLAEIQSKLDNLGDALAAGGSDFPSMRSRYALEEANLRVVQHDRSQLRAQLDELGGAPFDANRVRVVLGDFELMYDVANAEERKELLRLVVRRIEFYGVGQDVRFELSTDVNFPGASSISRRRWLPELGSNQRPTD